MAVILQNNLSWGTNASVGITTSKLVLTSCLVLKDACGAVFQVTSLFYVVLCPQFVVPYLVLVAETLRISRVALIPSNQRQWQPFVAQTAAASPTYILEHRQQFEDLAGLHDRLRILQAFPDWFVDQIWRKTKSSVINMNQYYTECPFYHVLEHETSRLMSWRLLTFYAHRHDKSDTLY